MKIERFEIPGLAQNSYIISSEGKAAVIDPIRDVDRYTAYTSEHKLTITHVLETHIHADFAAGSVTLAKGTGAELALSGHDEGEHYRYTMPHRALHNGQSIQIGAVRLEALLPRGTRPNISLSCFTTTDAVHLSRLRSFLETFCLWAPWAARIFSVMTRSKGSLTSSISVSMSGSLPCRTISRSIPATGLDHCAEPA